MTDDRRHKGWTEADLRRVLPTTSVGVQGIVRFIATHPGCTSKQMAAALPLKSKRSVGPTLNGLTRAAREFGVLDAGEARWPFEYQGKQDGHDRYDMPPWVRAVVLDVLGET